MDPMGLWATHSIRISLDICEKQKRVPKTCHKIFKVKSIKFTIVHAFEPCNVGIRVVLRVVQT